MKKITRILSLILPTAYALTLAAGVTPGCVTVNLGGNTGGKRAAGVTYNDPSFPFQRDKRDDVDAAWKNGKNGNVISYLSDCKDQSDPPLDGIVQGVLSGLTDLNIETSESNMFQGREARRVIASGRVDGVPSKTELLVFKRNQCIYILSYVGVEKVFKENETHFARFVTGFRAP